MSLLLSTPWQRREHTWLLVLLPLLAIVYQAWRLRGGGRWLASRPARWVGWVLVALLVPWMASLLNLLR